SCARFVRADVRRARCTRGYDRLSGAQGSTLRNTTRRNGRAVRRHRTQDVRQRRVRRRGPTSHCDRTSHRSGSRSAHRSSPAEIVSGRFEDGSPYRHQQLAFSIPVVQLAGGIRSASFGWERSMVKMVSMAADPARRQANYENVLRAPDQLAAEVMNGDLHTSARPAEPHAETRLVLGMGLGRGGRLSPRRHARRNRQRATGTLWSTRARTRSALANPRDRHQIVVPGEPADHRRSSVLGRSFLLALILTSTCAACKRDAPNKAVDRIEGIAAPPSPSTPPKPAGSVEPKSIEDFYGKLRLAALRGDRSYVANQIRYPINISASTEKGFAIKDASEFLSRYQEIMVEPLVRSISNCTTTEPSLGPVKIGTTEGSYLTIFHVCEDATGELCPAGPIRVVAIHLGPRPPPAVSDDPIGTPTHHSVESTAPNPSDTSESATDPICKRVLGGLEFFECSAVPRTPDYPDCRTVRVSSLDKRCPLTQVVLGITG